MKISIKPYFWAQSWPVWPKFGSPKNFLWILLLLVARHSSNQILENSKKTNFRAQLWPKCGSQKLFGEFYLYQMLDTVASYHCMHFQGKLMIHTQENCQKPHFGPNEDHLSPNSDPQFIFFFFFFFFFKSLASSVTRYHGQLSSCTISEKIN